MDPGALASLAPVEKAPTRELAREVSRVPADQAMSLLDAKEIETVSVVSMSSKETVPD